MNDGWETTFTFVKSLTLWGWSRAFEMSSPTFESLSMVLSPVGLNRSSLCKIRSS